MQGYETPTIEAYIVTLDGNTKIPLLLKGDSGHSLLNNSEALFTSIQSDARFTVTPIVLPYLTECRIEQNLSDLPKIQITLNMPYKEGIDALDSNLFEYLSNKLEVIIGYSVNKTKVYSGLMGFPSINIGSEVSVTLNGSGALGLANSKTDTEEFKLKGSPKNIIDKLLESASTDKKYLLLNIEPIDLNDKYYSDDTYSYTPTSDKSVLDSVKLLADKFNRTTNIVYDPDIDRYIVEIMTKDYLLRDKSAPLFVFSLSDPAISETNFPILNFTGSEQNNVFLPRRKGIVTQGIDSSSRKVQKVEASDSKSAVPRVGLEGQGAVEKDNSYHKGKEHMALDVNDPGTQTKLDNEYYNNTLCVDITFETIGLPQIDTKQRIRVEGASSRFNGDYVVFGYSHSIGPNGFTTTINARSNTVRLSPDYTIPAINPAVNADAITTGDFLEVTPGGV